MENNCFSHNVTVFHGRTLPEPGFVIGYGVIIQNFQLQVPMPACLAIISAKFRKYQTSDWKVFSPRYKTDNTLYGNIVFALKYEGVNLLVFKKLFEVIPSYQIEEWIKQEPYSVYNRKIWFLYEWLLERELDLLPLEKGNYVSILNKKLQYDSSSPINSPRQRIKNNLPGNVHFCPLVFRTPFIDKCVEMDFPEQQAEMLRRFGKDILYRASAFLMLKDSKASFSIEGESPTYTRAIRWGKAIGQAGTKDIDLEELLRLQQIIIDDTRFVKLGFRNEGGFVGTHDRVTGEPIPDHISARWQDLQLLINGLLDAYKSMLAGKLHPVIISAKIAYGFVFIHPFTDGNGRLHRYLIHHVLAESGFTPQGIVFPISSAILEKISDYRKSLEYFSLPLQDWIKWEKTDQNNIDVLNDTVDYYRYFDATPQAEFLFECIRYTLETVVPYEILYIKKYDSMKDWLNERFEMPDRLIDLLIRFLNQNNGELSKRAVEKEFSVLTPIEKLEIETYYKSL